MPGRGSLLVAAALALAAPAVAQSFRWWQDPTVQRQLELSRTQVEGLEREFSHDLEQRRLLRRELSLADAAVERALAEGTIGDDAAIVLIEKAEAARYRRNVARTMLLAKMYRLLTPMQRTQLRRLDRRDPRR